MIYCNKDTFIASGAAAKTLHSGAGKILAIMITTTQATGQTVTIYDNVAASGSVLATINTVTSCPIYWVFPTDLRPKFTTGLTINPGNCNVLLTLST